MQPVCETKKQLLKSVIEKDALTCCQSVSVFAFIEICEICRLYFITNLIIDLFEGAFRIST